MLWLLWLARDVLAAALVALLCSWLVIRRYGALNGGPEPFARDQEPPTAFAAYDRLELFTDRYHNPAGREAA